MTKGQGIPQLILLKQTSLCEDTLQANGKPKVVHIVVKNSPFCVTFGFASLITAQYHQTLDLHNYHCEVKLLYDDDSMNNKEVDFVKSKPLQVKSTLNQSGNKLTLEARIKVLTSQLEDMLFKVGVSVCDPQTKQEILVAYSEAIKVISKSDQVKKKKSSSSSNKKKRNWNESFSENLSQIEEKTTEANNFLAPLCEGNEILSALLFSGPFSSSITSLSSTATNIINNHERASVPSFPEAFKDFMAAYNNIPPVEKTGKIQKVLSTGSISGFAEILDLFWAEGLAREIGHQRTQVNVNNNSLVKDNFMDSNCKCESCPHKKELVRIENFYEDIFSLTGM